MSDEQPLSDMASASTTAQDNPPATPAGSPAPPPADEYRNRFTGLQGVIDGLYKRTGYHKLDEIPAKTVVEQAQAAAQELTQLRTTHEQLGTELQGLRSERDTLQQQLADTAKLVRRDQFIASKAPHLAAFMDFIPAAEDDAGQQAILEDFQNRMKTTGVTPSGPLPPASSPPAAISSSPGDLIHRMNAAVDAKDWEQVHVLQRQWDAIDLKT